MKSISILLPTRNRIVRLKKRAILSRIVSFIVIFTIVFLCTSCSKNNEDNTNVISADNTDNTNGSPISVVNTSEIIYTGQTITLPGEFAFVSSLTTNEDFIYFTATKFDFNEEKDFNYYAFTYSANVYKMNFDGTELIEALPNYKPITKLSEEYSGGNNILAMRIDSDGNVWVVEDWISFSYRLPENYDGITIDDYLYTEHDYGCVIRKLDNSGNEILSIDISENIFERYMMNYHMLDSCLSYISEFEIDNEGNVYIFYTNAERARPEVHVYDTNGNHLFYFGEYVNRLVKLADGNVVFIRDADPNDLSEVYVLCTINVTTKDIGDPIVIPDTYTVTGYYNGVNEYDIFTGNREGIYGFSIEQNELVKILDYVNSNISIQDSVAREGKFLANGTIIISDVTGLSNSPYHTSGYQITILTPTDEGELQSVNQNKTELILATMNSEFIADIVAGFNNANPDYYITIKDYSVGSNDYDDELNRLNIDIITGNIPDILDLHFIPDTEYILRGYLTDLYPFIDSDSDISRDSFTQNVLQASENNGKLYSLFSNFQINAIISNTAITGSNIKWTVDEFGNVLKTHPEAEAPVGMWFTGESSMKMHFLKYTIRFCINDYINWDSGETHFGDDFTRLLETINYYVPSDSTHLKNTYDEAGLIHAGHQLIFRHSIGKFNYCIRYKELFGDDYVLRNIPGSSGSINIDGYNFAILEKSNNKEAAWGFIRTILSEDWQLKMTDKIQNFPTNQIVFNKIMQDELEAEYTGKYSLSEKDVKKVLAVLNSCTSAYNIQISKHNIATQIENIILEDASDYFNGYTNLQETVDNIQYRVSMVISERTK